MRHEAARRTKEAGDVAKAAGDVARLALGTLAPGTATAAADAVQNGREALDRAATAGRAARDRTLARAAGTRAGGAVGSFVQRVARRAADVPLLSLPQAVLDGRRGVSHLSSLAAAAPDDPAAAIRLAEALLHLERDRRVLLLFRTAWNPYAPLIAESVRMAQALGEGELVRPAEQMLRRAYALAVLRLRADRDDAEALHVVARVFLATGQPDGGIKPCTAAVACGRSAVTRAQALFTLALLEQRCGRPAAARSAATRAVDGGCSLGWKVLAELVFAARAEGSTGERMATHQEMVERIEPADELAYHGFRPPRSGDLWRTVLRDQSGKATDGYRRVARNVARWQGQAVDVLRQRRGVAADRA